MIRWILPVPILALCVACTCDGESARGTSASQQSATAAPSVSKASPPKRALPATRFRFPAPPRLVAIGDVHGDLDATRRALRLAGAVDAGDRWAGGDLVVVQTGDQLDRGDDEQAIIDLFESLAKQAKAAGGAVHSLNGNHETMNVAGDFRYVTEGGFADFDDVVPAVPKALLQRFPAHMRGRIGAFMPGGPYAQKLAARRLVVVVGSTVFAHGGVTSKVVDYGIQRLNDETAAWMRGATKEPPAPVTDPEGPVWTRRYSTEDKPPDCAGLTQVLSKLGVRRMVMGHTPQKDGITQACGGAAWRIDVGMAEHYGGEVAVLEIRGDVVQPLVEESAAAAAE